MTFGLKRTEILSAQFNGATLLVLALRIIYEGITHILTDLIAFIITAIPARRHLDGGRSALTARAAAAGSATRGMLIRRGLTLEYLTLIWNVVGTVGSILSRGGCLVSRAGWVRAGLTPTR